MKQKSIKIRQSFKLKLRYLKEDFENDIARIYETRWM